ncbi:Calmodulin-binding protein 60 G [Hirschfeldia incana]|nr:Calmodulin-binding protein 60 G [Hirschfeldia incana]
MRHMPNNQFLVEMENMIRKIVREELERLIQQHHLSLPWSPSRSETPSSRTQFKLRFINSPPPSIFTGAKIEDKNGSPLAIELVEAATNARVVSGPLSSSRVDLVPLNADFTEESWTVDVFKRSILKPREGKRPLLAGDVTLTLKNGVGAVAVAFTDNSIWSRCRKFRLGARLAGDGAVEAISEAFKCKDQRGESYKKHYPPYPGDEVWRLEKIAKDGASALRLAERDIYIVKDFRRFYAKDPNELYRILAVGGGGISKKIWESIVSHAMSCVLDETEYYIYDATAHDVSLVFNSVYEVTKVFIGGVLRNVDQLPSYQLDQLKHEAYQNINLFRDSRTFADHPQRSLQCPQNPGFGIACPGFQQHVDFQGPSDSSMHAYFTGSCSTSQPETLMSFENSPAKTFHIDPTFIPTFRDSFRASEHDMIHDELQSLVSRGCNKNNEDENGFAYHHHHEMPSNWSPGAAIWEQQEYNNLCVSVSGTEEAGMYDVRIANIGGSPRARWCKVKAAFKIRQVWRHTKARKRGKACKKPCLLY